MIAPCFLRHLALSAFAVLSAVVSFIGLVDPFGVAPITISLPGFNEKKPLRVNIDRQIKPYEVWERQPRTLFLGTSRIQQSMDPAALDGTRYAPAYNAAVPAAEMGENVVLLEQYFQIDKNLHHVFLEVFLYNFTRHQAQFPKRTISSFINNAVSMQMSGDAVFASIVTLSENLRPTMSGAAIMPGGFWLPPASLDTRASFNPEPFIDTVLRMENYYPDGMVIEPTAMDALNKIREMCERHNAELHLIVTPCYPWDDYRLHALGYWPLLEKWMEMLSTYENVICFSQYNEMLTEEVSSKMHWWNDPLHFNTRYGSRMLRKIAGEQEPDVPANLLCRVTKENVKQIVGERLSGLKAWMRSNTVFTDAFQAAKSRSTMLVEPIDGKVAGQDLSVEGADYPIVQRVGGAVEHAERHGNKLYLRGWASDDANNQPAIAIVASVDDVVVARSKPTVNRPDIEAGVGPGVRPAGFAMTVPVSSRSTSIPVVRLFTLTHDSKAVELSCSLSPGREFRIGQR